MNKKNLILLIILLLLAAGAYFYQAVYQAQVASKAATSNFLAALPVSAIDKIIISSAKNRVTLLKANNSWQVEGAGDFAVAADLNEALNETLGELTTSTISVASLNSEARATFALTPDLATTLSLWQGEEKLSEVSLGKSEGAYSYFTRPEDSKIYATTLDLSVFNAALDYRDQNIFQADASAWTSLNITNNLLTKNSNLKLVKKDATWFDESAKVKLDNNKVAALLNLVSNLRADAIPAQKLAGTGLDKPSLILSATSSVLKNSLLIGNAQGENYFVKKDSSANIYLISKKKVELLLTDINKLK